MADVNPVGGRARHQQLLVWGIITLLAIASFPLHLDGPTSDVSWLISMCERILAGETAYVDIFETTPPVPALLYMPAVIAGKTFGVPPEWALIVFTQVCGLLTLALTDRILSQTPKEQLRSYRTILISAALLLFILPSDTYAQREYFAALFGLPLVAVFIRHANTGQWPSLATRSLAAVLAALTVAIKPPLFVLPGAFLFAYYLWRTHDPRFLVASGLLAAGALAGIITAASLAWFPSYLGPMWDLMRDVYVPAKSHPLTFLKDRATLVVLCAFVIAQLLQIGQRHCATFWSLLAPGAGFLLTYFLQAKYFNYHVYPAAFMVSIALALAVVERVGSLQYLDALFKTVISTALAVVCLTVSVVLYRGLNDGRPRFIDLSWAADLKGATVLAISPDITTSFPLNRQIGGTWINRTHSQWVARYTRHMLTNDDLSKERRLALTRYYEEDLEWILNIIERKKPDIILVDLRTVYSWLMRDLRARRPHFLDDYVAIAEESHVRALRRRAQPQS